MMFLGLSDDVHEEKASFLQSEKTALPTDGPTNRRTDGRTDRPSYRDARTHLKSVFMLNKGSRCEWVGHLLGAMPASENRPERSNHQTIGQLSASTSPLLPQGGGSIGTHFRAQGISFTFHACLSKNRISFSPMCNVCI